MEKHIENPEQQPEVSFDRKLLFPNRRIKKAYRKYVSPDRIADKIPSAEQAMISFLESGGDDKSFIRIYDTLGKYERERSIAIDEIIGTDSENLGFTSEWEKVRDEIDDAVLEPLQNIGRIVKGVDFYRQDMERLYNMPITDEEERREMMGEIEMISELVRRQCFEVSNNIKWLESQLR